MPHLSVKRIYTFQFFVFLVIILVGEAAVVLLIYFDESSYKEVIKSSVEATVMKKYHNNTTATVQTFDLIQEGVCYQQILLIFIQRMTISHEIYSNHIAFFSWNAVDQLVLRIGKSRYTIVFTTQMLQRQESRSQKEEVHNLGQAYSTYHSPAAKIPTAKNVEIISAVQIATTSMAILSIWM